MRRDISTVPIGNPGIPEIELCEIYGNDKLLEYVEAIL
jgi:hypothetical protein